MTTLDNMRLPSQGHSHPDSNSLKMGQFRHNNSPNGGKIHEDMGRTCELHTDWPQLEIGFFFLLVLINVIMLLFEDLL